MKATSPTIGRIAWCAFVTSSSVDDPCGEFPAENRWYEREQLKPDHLVVSNVDSAVVPAELALSTMAAIGAGGTLQVLSNLGTVIAASHPDTIDAISTEVANAIITSTASVPPTQPSLRPALD